jgi:hypothetical protein
MAPRGLTKMPRDPKFHNFTCEVYGIVFCKNNFWLSLLDCEKSF